MALECKTSAAFDELLKSPKLVAMFTASWCGPCNTVKPKFKELAGSKTDIKFVLVDVDENGETAEKFDVSSMPTFMFFKDGSKTDIKFVLVDVDENGETAEKF